LTPVNHAAVLAPGANDQQAAAATDAQSQPCTSQSTADAPGAAPGADPAQPDVAGVQAREAPRAGDLPLETATTLVGGGLLIVGAGLSLAVSVLRGRIR
jgi:hypothetical protein